jgi:hypothetical protein
MPVPTNQATKVSCRVFVCLPLSTILLLDIRSASSVWHFLFLILIMFQVLYCRLICQSVRLLFNAYDTTLSYTNSTSTVRSSSAHTDNLFSRLMSDKLVFYWNPHNYYSSESTHQ